MYWHIIVGDPNSDFAMESYTEQTSGTAFGSFSGGIPSDFGALSLEKTVVMAGVLLARLC